MVKKTCKHLQCWLRMDFQIVFLSYVLNIELKIYNSNISSYGVTSKTFRAAFRKKLAKVWLRGSSKVFRIVCQLLLRAALTASLMNEAPLNISFFISNVILELKKKTCEKRLKSFLTSCKIRSDKICSLNGIICKCLPLS